MVHHWSGVDVGEYFDLTFEYNEARYSQARVLVPFQRCPTTGFPKCMLEGIDFQVKNVPSDSEWHVRRSLHMKVEPPLKGAKRQKALKDSSMRSFFTAAPTKEDSDHDVDALPETPAPKPHHIPLESTPSDSVGDLAGGAAWWDERRGLWCVSADSPRLQLFASFMSPRQRTTYGLRTPEPEVEVIGSANYAVPQPAGMQGAFKLCRGHDLLHARRPRSKWRK